MKNKLYKIIVYVLVVLGHDSHAQFNHASALQKYWNYRYALVGDDIDPSFRRWEPGFLQIGTDIGHSLPMRSRYQIRNNIQQVEFAFNTHYDRSDVLDYLNITRTHENSAGLRYGWCQWIDCPTDMGMYLAVLATEYALMTKNMDYQTVSNTTGQPVGPPTRGANYREQMDRLMHEISCAVSAVDRLDANSDDYHGIPGQNGNGFFVKDDVPYTFAQDGKFGNAQVLAPDFLTNTNSRYHRGHSFWNVHAGFNGYRHQAKPSSECNGIGGQPEPLLDVTIGGTMVRKTIDPMSQDQLMKLLFGLIFIRKYVTGSERDMRVPLNTSPWSYSTADNLNQRAKDWIDRTLWRLITDCFIIRNERGGNQVCSGGNATMFQSPFKDIYNMWGEGDFYGSFANCSNHYYSGLVWWGANEGYKAWVTSPSVDLNDLLLLNTSLWPLGVKDFILSEIVNNLNQFDHEMYVYLTCMNNSSTSVTYVAPLANPYNGNITGVVGNHIDRLASPANLDYQLNALMGDAKNLLYGTTASPDNHLQSFMNRNNFWCLHEDTLYRFGNGRDQDRLHARNGLFYMLAHNIYSLQRMDRYNFLDMADNTIAKLPDLMNRTVRGVFPRAKDIEMINSSGVKSKISYQYGNNTNEANIYSANSINFNDCVFQNGSRARLIAPHIDHIASQQNGMLSIELGAVVEIVENSRMPCTGNTTVIGGNGFVPTTTTVLSEAPPQENTSSGLHKLAEIKDDIVSEKSRLARLYPNPTENDATIRLVNYEKTTVNIKIYNMLGREVIQFSNIDIIDDEQNYYMNLEKLNTGIYIVKIDQGDYSTSLKLEKR